MQCLFRFSIVLAIISIVISQTVNFDIITSPTQNQPLLAGSLVDIVWTYSSQYAGTVSIALLMGSSSSALNPGSLLAGLTSIHPEEFWTDGPQLN
jgi:hypothetical protein